MRQNSDNSTNPTCSNNLPNSTNPTNSANPASVSSPDSAINTLLQDAGFRLTSVEDVYEIDTRAYVARHEKTSARLLFLKNTDENKAFSITFKTPPKDNTGVFHILEHSVLCGSDKYPVKEPFVNLLKTSMQTFLNAMTFPDKTMYPVASTNDQDLLNLASVYLDAVFHPAIYQKETIFQQEGWHFETSPQFSLNGVVYNEMKGALSEPEEMLGNVINAHLFPDTCYGFESGGLPNSIPNLSYEQFLDEHRAHYRPDNSYIILYGNIDVAPLLALIDGALCEAVPNTTTPCARTIQTQQPVISRNHTYSMDIAQENACCGVGYVVGNATEFTRMIATSVLLDALCGSNEAPLKRALLDENIADDVDFALRSSIAQPYVLACAKGIQKHALPAFEQLVYQHVSELVAQNINPQLIEAALSHEEFLLRERDFGGYADGVINAISALSGWLYNDNYPVESLRYEASFAYLREQASTGYFEQLAREIFLENNHVASGEILACSQKQTTEQTHLSQIEQTLTEPERASIEKTLETLREAQVTPDSPQALATLPQLTPQDITHATPWGACTLDESAPVPCLRHNIQTHGISYMQLYYDISAISFEDLPYVAILGVVLGKLGTKRWSAAELDTLVQNNTGALHITPKVIGKDTSPHDFQAFLAVGASCLEHKTKTTLEIINEVLHTSDMHDISRIKDILMQMRIQFEQLFLSAGHSVTMERVSSYIRESAVVSQQVSGIDFYIFLKDLLAHFDERAIDLPAKLKTIATRIFHPNNLLASFTGTQKVYEEFLQTLSADEWPTTCGKPGSLLVPRPTIKREAFIVPTDVTYTSCGYDRRLLPDAPAFHGSQFIVANACSLDYLWNEVRVKGGAYGAGLRIPAKHDIMFYSYRDPRIDETLARFRATAEWLYNFTPDEREFDGYVVSSVAALDNPLKARAMIVAQNNAYLKGREDNFRLQCRAEVLDSSRESINSFANTLENTTNKNCYCTIGNRDIIGNAKTAFNTIELF